MAGKEIRTKALSRTKKSRHVATTDEWCSPRGGERTEGKKRRPVTVDSGEGERNLVEMHVAATNDMETKRLKMEQDRLELDRNNDAQAMDRQNRLDEGESRRISLYERRVDLGMEHAAADRENRRDIRAE